MSEEVTSGVEKEVKRLSPTEWQEIRTLYELGDHTISDLARAFGVTASAISQHFRKHKVERGSKKAAIAAAAAAAAAAEASSFIVQRRKRIEDTKEKCYKSFEMLHVLIHQEVVEAKKAGVSYGAIEKNLKALRTAAVALQITRTERYALLDVAGDVDELALPQIVIRDLSEAEIAALAVADHEAEEDDFATSLPTIAGEDDEVVEEGM